MKIVCDACSAKYSIADEKVKGKVFKIRCKKCSNIIVVRGNAGGAAEEPAAAAPAGTFDQKETRVYDYGGYEGEAGGTPAAGADEAVWHVVVDQEQVGPITVAEVQGKFASGEIDAETYIWREGFADWLPLSQVPDFASLVAGGSTTTAQPSSGQDAVASMFGASNFDEGGTSRSDPNDVFAAHAAKAAAPADEDDGAGDLFGSASASKAGKSAPAEGGLFGGGAAAASAKGGGGGGGGVSSMKGQRSENSVLFSLNNLAALASDSPKAAAAAPAAAASSSSGAAQHGGGEGSGLIDIRSMASAYLGPQKTSGAPGKPGGNVGSMDDLPVFSTAAFSEPAVIIPTMGGSRGNNKMLYIALAGVGALALVAVILVVVMLSKSDKPAAAASGPVAAGGAGDGTGKAGGDGKPEGTGTGDGTAAAGTPAGDGAGTGSQVAANDKPAPTTDTPPITGDKPDDKPSKPTSDKPADKPRSDRDKPADKPRSDRDKPSNDKPAADKPASDKPASGGSCLDEVACLLADKPPACCAKYGKGGGGGGSKPTTGGGGGGGGGGASQESLEKADISAGIAKVRGRVDGCAAKSSAKGTVKVSVKVSPGGSVSSVTVKESPDPALGKCVASAVEKATFTKTQNGGSFSYPFKF